MFLLHIAPVVKLNQTNNNKTQRGERKLLQVGDMFGTLIVVMVSQVYAYVQAHQIECIKCVQVFVYSNYISIKLAHTRVFGPSEVNFGVKC